MPRPADDRLMWESFTQYNVQREEEKIVEKIERALVEEGIDLNNLTREEFDKMLEEGLFDRLRGRVKARVAGLGAGVKSIGGRLKGAAQKGVGKLATAVGGGELGQQLQQKGQETIGAAKASVLDAKSLSLVNTHLKDLSKYITNMEKDFQKLGLDPKSMRTTNPEAAEALTSLKTALTQIINAFASTGPHSRGAAIQKLRQKRAPAPATAAPAA